MKKLFAFVAVSLMICGAFACYLLGDDTSAAQDRTYTYHVGEYFDVDLPWGYGYIYNELGSCPIPGCSFSPAFNDGQLDPNGSRIYGTPTTPGTYPINGPGSVYTFVILANTNTVTFNANGGSCSIPSSTVNSGTAISLPSASKAYSTFSGWFTAASGGTRVGGAGDSYTVSSNTTLYAQYNVIPVSITTTQGTAYLVQGTSFAYTVGTFPADASVSVSGANWLTVSNKTVTGVPTVSVAPAGTYHVTVTAQYGTQSAVQTFDIVVAEKLIFESVPTGGIIATPV